MKSLLVVTVLIAVTSALKINTITGPTPPTLHCPDSLCSGKYDGNYAYKDPYTGRINKHYFIQCDAGSVSCQACWPLNLIFKPECNQCLYDHKDDCVSTKSWNVITQASCPDKCPYEGPDFSGNIKDEQNPNHYIACWKGVTVGCIPCAAGLKFNQQWNICDYEDKHTTKPNPYTQQHPKTTTTTKKPTTTTTTTTKKPTTTTTTITKKPTTTTTTITKKPTTSTTARTKKPTTTTTTRTPTTTTTTTTTRKPYYHPTTTTTTTKKPYYHSTTTTTKTTKRHYYDSTSSTTTKKPTTTTTKKPTTTTTKKPTTTITTTTTKPTTTTKKPPTTTTKKPTTTFDPYNPYHFKTQKTTTRKHPTFTTITETKTKKFLTIITNSEEKYIN